MVHRRKTGWIAAMGLLVAMRCASASAAGQGSTAMGAAFAGTCAGNETFSFLGDPGSIKATGTVDFGDGKSYYTCNPQYSGVGGFVSSTASNSGSFFGNTWSNSASASAAPKQIHIAGTETGSHDTEFSGADAIAGWNELFHITITDPNLHIPPGGVTGYWAPTPFHIDGNMHVTNSGDAWLEVGAYENNNMVAFDSGDGSAWNYFTTHNTLPNGDVLSSWDVMEVQYRLDNGNETMNVNSNIAFALPVTFTSSTLDVNAGFYAQLQVSSGSFGGDTAPLTSVGDFSNTIGWGGQGVLVLNGVAYDSSHFSVTGQSAGIDYATAFAPEPATIGLFGLGLGGVLLAARRRRR